MRKNTVRPEVVNLVSQGPLPPSLSSVERIKTWQIALEKIMPPLTNDEAGALVALFPAVEDDCFGLAWTLIHLIETAPDWPSEQALQNQNNPWVMCLRQRCGL
jgi:hypothetical protein